MTVVAGKLRGVINHVLIVILINIPSVSFGLAFGWVALTSGEDSGDGDGGRGAVVAAVTTFLSAVAGVPLSAWALARGRKFAIIATSACFVLCWSLKLAGGCAEGACGWWGVAARVVAGLGAAAAWAVAPLLAGEMCDERWLGATVSALPLGHNIGVLLMYIAADAAAPRRTLLWCCLGLSALHCAVSLFMPESPSFLAAQGKIQEAHKALAFLRGAPPTDAQMAALPTSTEQQRSAWELTRDMLSDRNRRRAFIIGTIAVMGQEACGIHAVLQYAERVFVMAQDATDTALGAATPASLVSLAGAMAGATLEPPENATIVVAASASPAGEAVVLTTLASPARHAVVLGVVQLVFSALALYLIECAGRRPLLVWSAALTGGALAAAAALVGAGAGECVAGVSWAGAVLAVAVAADAVGLASTPYAIIAEMYHYEYRGCAMLLALTCACAGNALEAGLFPAVAAAGLAPALALAAALTLAYALFAVAAVPETRHRTPEQIYAALCPACIGPGGDCESGKHDDAFALPQEKEMSIENFAGDEANNTTTEKLQRIPLPREEEISIENIAVNGANNTTTEELQRIPLPREKEISIENIAVNLANNNTTEELQGIPLPLEKEISIENIAVNGANNNTTEELQRITLPREKEISIENIAVNGANNNTTEELQGIPLPLEKETSIENIAVNGANNTITEELQRIPLPWEREISIENIAVNGANNTITEELQRIPLPREKEISIEYIAVNGANNTITEELQRITLPREKEISIKNIAVNRANNITTEELQRIPLRREKEISIENIAVNGANNITTEELQRIPLRREKEISIENIAVNGANNITTEELQRMSLRWEREISIENIAVNGANTTTTEELQGTSLLWETETSLEDFVDDGVNNATTIKDNGTSVPLEKKISKENFADCNNKANKMTTEKQNGISMPQVNRTSVENFADDGTNNTTEKCIEYLDALVPQTGRSWKKAMATENNSIDTDNTRTNNNSANHKNEDESVEETVNLGYKSNERKPEDNNNMKSYEESQEVTQSSVKRCSAGSVSIESDDNFKNDDTKHDITKL